MSEFLIEAGKGLGWISLGVGSYLFARLRRRHDKSRSILACSRADLSVQDLLATVRIQLGADRVFLARFHNGDHFVDGAEIMRYSRTNESVAPGVNFLRHAYEGVLTSMVPQEMKLVFDDGPSFTLTGNLADGHFRRMLDASGTSAIARFIVMRGEQILGFVGADWTHRAEPPANIALLETLAGQLEQTMSTRPT